MIMFKDNITGLIETSLTDAQYKELGSNWDMAKWWHTIEAELPITTEGVDSRGIISHPSGFVLASGEWALRAAELRNQDLLDYDHLRDLAKPLNFWDSFEINPRKFYAMVNYYEQIKEFEPTGSEMTPKYLESRLDPSRFNDVKNFWNKFFAKTLDIKDIIK